MGKKALRGLEGSIRPSIRITHEEILDKPFERGDSWPNSTIDSTKIEGKYSGKWENQSKNG